MVFDLSSYKFERESDELFKRGHKMLNLSQLTTAADSLRKKEITTGEDFVEMMKKNYMHSDVDLSRSQDTMGHILVNTEVAERIKTVGLALSSSKGAIAYVKAIIRRSNNRDEHIAYYLIEWHSKYTLSKSCLILFFVGAPLGAIIKKGGLGLPMVISVLIFIMFHVIVTIGRKMVQESSLTAFEGMWMAPAIILPIGLFLTYKATTDSPIFDKTWYTNTINSVFRKK